MTRKQPPPRADQLAPHSVEAEEAVLGALFLTPEEIEQLMFLSVRDFFIVRNGWIWEAMRSLHSRGEPIDHLTVATELEQVGRLEEVGGAAYLLSLISKIPSALNVEGYARIVEQMALRRQLLDAASRVARAAHSEETNIDAVLQQAETAVLEITAARQRHQLHVITDHRAAFDEFAAKVDALEDGKTLALASPWKTFDQITGHMMQMGSYIAILAPSHQFKTTLAIDLARHWAETTPHWVLFVSQELTAPRFVARMAAQKARLSYKKWLDGKLPVEDMPKIRRTAHDMMASLANKFYLVSGRHRMATIHAHARKLTRQHEGPGIVFVDTMQKLLDADARDKRQGLSAASAQADSLKLATGSMVVALVQHRMDRTNSRSPEVLIPHEGSTQESNAFYQDADVVLALFYADFYRRKFSSWEYDSCPPHHILLRVLKGRDGGSGQQGTLGVMAATPRLCEPHDLPPEYRTQYSGVHRRAL